MYKPSHWLEELRSQYSKGRVSICGSFKSTNTRQTVNTFREQHKEKILKFLEQERTESEKLSHLEEWYWQTLRAISRRVQVGLRKSDINKIIGSKEVQEINQDFQERIKATIMASRSNRRLRCVINVVDKDFLKPNR